MAKYTQYFDPQKIPQTKPLPKSKQVPNSAGGYVYAIEPWSQLYRFLILGTTGGTYYSSEHDLTVQNYDVVLACIEQDGRRVVDMILEVSKEGRAAKNDQALFTLALCAAADSVDTRRYALMNLDQVARTGTHLFEFMEYVQLFRRWGRALRAAVGNWYKRNPDHIALQVMKYRQRNGWTHRDALRMAHPTPETPEQNDLFNWICNEEPSELLLSSIPMINGFMQIQRATTAAEAAKLISEYRLPRETVPTQFLKDAVVWDALLDHMPMTALIRNLGNMSACGLLKPNSNAAMEVADKLSDDQHIRSSRLHPMSILTALSTYHSGSGLRGHNTWTPVPQVIDALDDAFYKAFNNVTPTNKRYYVGVDVSGSMRTSFCDGVLSCCMGAAAMAMEIARTEPRYFIQGFCDTMVDLDFTAKTSLTDAVSKASKRNFGRTDCAQPMIHALNNGIEADVFVVITDNETYAGKIHPSEALRVYRKQTGIQAKLAVIAMTSTGFSIADPSDPNMLDFVGFDANLPSALSQFALL
jgi:60 kDa SS-A/Ro ribonucleoprotein